ncbi:MAG: barstar family protein [Betaproteobacteria bacterium]|nr:barstar family protein [Betaproteobacteria bacterium]
MSRYYKILRSGRAGVYAAPRLVGPLRAAARRAGIAWHDLDLAGVADDEGFFRRCAAVFALPDYFGHNRDALHECLLDRAGDGTPGAVVHWRRGEELARRSPAAVTAALEILREAAIYWGSSGRVFLVVVDRDSVTGLALSPLR